MPPLSRGALCISIDVELAWGVWDCLTPEYMVKCLELERSIVRRILQLFERYDIRATWAIVGHLLQEREATSSSELPAWFAPDIVGMIRDAHPGQEIGSHSYAHIYFSGSTREAASADLSKARSIHERNGLAFKTFVFPRNMVAHVDLLAGVGIRVFRGVDQGWHAAIPGPPALARMSHLVDTIIPSTPAVVRPRKHAGGLVEVPGSMLLMGRNGLRKLVRPWALELKAKRGLCAAARQKGVFHLWFHPTNFYYDAERQFATLESIVGEAATLRAEGRLDIRPMGSFA